MEFDILHGENLKKLSQVLLNSYRLLTVPLMRFQISDLITHCKKACEYFAFEKKEKAFQLILKKWAVLTEVLKILHVAYVATKQLQFPVFTLSDFFACWLKIKLQLKKFLNNGMLTNFAQIFMEFFLIRERELLNYPAMLCAVYLDRRYRQELKNPEHIEIAKRTLANHYERILSQRPKSQSEDQPEPENSVDSFEEYLRQSDETNDPPPIVVNAEEEMFNRGAFMEMLQGYEQNVTRQHHTLSLFEDWETLKSKYPELYQLATIIYGIPPTQVSVERSFSAMAIIFNDKRSQLGHGMLENILTIKLNKELVNEINERDLQQL